MRTYAQKPKASQKTPAGANKILNLQNDDRESSRHRTRRRVGKRTVALSMRLLGEFVAHVVCGGRKAVRRHCSGVGAHLFYTGRRMDRGHVAKAL